MKRTVCLANSRKIRGRCIAGREIVDKRAARWVRPVGNRPSGELWPNEYRYGNGQQIEVGDVFRIALVGHRPHAYQTENYLVDSSTAPTYEKKATYSQLLGCVDHAPGIIWIDGPSSAYGENDQVPETAAPALGGSLKFVRAADFEIVIAHEWPTFGNKRAMRGSFTSNNHHYVLKITDPLLEAEFAQHADGRYQIGEALLCISLGEPYKDHAYKLIASVIRKGFYGII